MDFGIATVAAITAICYLGGLVVKATPWNNDKYIPVACGTLGGILGLTGVAIGMPEMVGLDQLTAFAVGVVSGLAATGINQIFKQMSDGDE